MVTERFDPTTTMWVNRFSKGWDTHPRRVGHTSVNAERPETTRGPGRSMRVRQLMTAVIGAVCTLPSTWNWRKRR